MSNVQQINIPEGYVYLLLPKEHAERYFTDRFWLDIKEPTINEAAEYLNLSVEKIKKDLRNYQCPLRKTSDGGKGRGNSIRLLKSSVEIYRAWLKNK